MKHAPTEQQQACVDLFKSGKPMKVRAVAGSGKTSTLTLMANATQESKVYVAFNKAIATQAERLFPSNTACKTGHGLGWAVMNKVYSRSGRDKMNTNPRARDVADILNIPKTIQISSTESIHDTTMGFIINETVKKFCQSDAVELGPRHVFTYPKLEMLDKKDLAPLAERVLKGAQRLWDQMRDPATSVPVGFDGYLKQWGLSGPVISQDVILVDEAQDLNGAMFSILKQQLGQIVYVGDPHQQIYGWRGAVNAMEQIKSEEMLLSQSFRFGNDIGRLATNILRTIDSGVPDVRGFDKVESSLYEETTEPCTYLFRKNSSMLEYIVGAGNLNNVFVQGGVKEIISYIEAIIRLDDGKSTTHSELLGFKDLKEVRDYADRSHNAELKRFLKIYDNYDVNSLLNMLSQIPTSERPGMTVLSTAHKSKGCEWDTVQLYDDFAEQPKAGEDGEYYDKDETRLIYVAATRCKHNLILPGWMDEEYCTGLTTKSGAPIAKTTGANDGNPF